MDKSLYTPEYQALLTLLRQLREEAGLRQSDLAELLGRSQQFVSKYEAGERRVDFVEVRAICRALGIDLRDFVKRYETRLRRR
ncbi:MAG: helix-turn-helix domain-containing protein [Acidimicrobiales bacterium]